MNRFKLAQGNEKPTGKKEPYLVTGADEQTRCFGIFPACDNPIQLLGLCRKSENTDIPFGKHYNRDAKIALHNEQAYKFCLYAKHIYNN